jgi:hypothetical protein
MNESLLNVFLSDEKLPDTELKIIAAAISSKPFADRVVPIIGADSETGLPYMDFSSYEAGMLWSAVRLAHEVAVDLSTEWSAEAFYGQLNLILEALVGSGRIENNAQTLANITQVAQAAVVKSKEINSVIIRLLGEVIPEWLKRRRMSKLIVRHSTGSLSVSDFVKEAARIELEADASSGEGGIEMFGNTTVASRGRRIATPWPTFNVAFRGLYTKETTMFACASGGGKSCISCHLAVSAAVAGHKVLLVQSEQNPAEYQARMISALCRIPHDLLVDGYDMKEMPKSVKEKVGDLYTNLAFLDTNTRHGYTIDQNYDQILQMAQDKLGRIDLVSVDWPGNMLSVPEGTHEWWGTYKTATNKICNMAKRLDHAAVFFSQVNEAQAPNTKQVRSDHVAGNKQQHHLVTNQIGVSMRAKSNIVGNGQEAYYRQQTWNAGKARKKGSGLIMYRLFEYQIFTDDPLIAGIPESAPVKGPGSALSTWLAFAEDDVKDWCRARGIS